MSGADCHACRVSVGTLPNPLGSTHEPMGACQNCHALACGHHGNRDPNVPEFICVECDPLLLAASAVSLSGAPAASLVDQILAGYHLSNLPAERWRIDSLNDFVHRRRGYGPSFFWDQDLRLGSDLAGLAIPVDSPAEPLLAGARVIMTKLNFPSSSIADYLRTLR